MKINTGIIIGLAALTVAGGCGRGGKADKPPKPRTVVATVNGEKLLWRDMEKRAEGFLNDEVNTRGLVIPEGKRDEALDYFRRRAVKVFVFKALFMADAKRLGLQVTDKDRKLGMEKLEQVLKRRNLTPDAFFAQSPMGEKQMRQEFEEGLLIDKLLEQVVQAQIKVEDRDMDEIAAEISKARLECRKRIEALRKELLEGADFAAVARRGSECPSARNGGDLDEFERGKCRFGAEFEKAAFSQKVGAIGPVAETRLGFHIIRVSAHTKARAATDSTPAIPETVRASHILVKAPSMSGRELQNEVMRRKYARGVEAYYRSLRDKAKVECIFTDLVL